MATDRWLGSSGDWSTPLTECADAIPGPLDQAVIAAPGSYTVTVTTPEDVGSVRLNDPGAILDIQSSGTLAVSGPVVVRSGILFLDGGSIDGGTVQTSSGATTIGPDAQMHGYGLIHAASLINKGTIDANVAAQMGFQQQYLEIAANDFANDGAIYALNGSILSVNFFGDVDLLDFTNNGTIKGVNSTIIIGKFTNVGTIRMCRRSKSAY